MSQQSSSKNNKRIKWGKTTYTPTNKIQWGPTVFKKEFKSVSRTNAIWDALVWVSENDARLVDIIVYDNQPHFKYITIEIRYKEDERMHDYNGEPCWLSDL